MNRFTKTCLVTIIFLLALIAVRPIISPQPAVAEGRYQYLVVNTSTWSSDIQAELNKRVAEGWELVSPIVSAQMPGVILIFRKEAH
jgi:hypothetical protein